MQVRSHQQLHIYSVVRPPIMALEPGSFSRYWYTHCQSIFWLLPSKTDLCWCLQNSMDRDISDVLLHTFWPACQHTLLCSSWNQQKKSAKNPDSSNNYIRPPRRSACRSVFCCCLMPTWTAIGSNLRGYQKIRGGGGSKSTFIAVLLTNFLEIHGARGGNPLDSPIMAMYMVQWEAQ
jgi:hypothetical protein